ncbi:CpsD/CapB family tyrosine-protein kinase [Shinella kummerowiae]|uniref:CpsD/CapB family tyrosine-protein kinase n=1 Tax=Shinella kummerowiae TaxID=417745 RepID=UPI0021B56AC1|nr:CpsD/CapB family tyrosine-protein kinase [Shinella kummerowiae]MCT7668002.1 CpsD/CapB family tyrosine-protein kinase [Shinella kummerowiae]
MSIGIRPAFLHEALEIRNSDRGREQAPDARSSFTKDNAWPSLKEFRLSPQTRAAHGIVAGNKSDPACAAFDLLRTKLMQTLKQNGWRSVAITSPMPRCGKSLVAVNLALSLAELEDTRTVLLDLDLRNPGLATLLEMDASPSMEFFLRGEYDVADALRLCGKNLAIGANLWPARLASEILQGEAAAKALKTMVQDLSADVVLYDMTSMLTHDDVLAFLPNVDCVILVAAAEQSTFAEIDACERMLAERTNVLGVVLNKCRHGPAY